MERKGRAVRVTLLTVFKVLEVLEVLMRFRSLSWVRVVDGRHNDTLGRDFTGALHFGAERQDTG